MGGFSCRSDSLGKWAFFGQAVCLAMFVYLCICLLYFVFTCLHSLTVFIAVSSLPS